MAGLLFQRVWSLSLQPPGSLTSTVFASDCQAVTPMRVTFECERTLFSSKNKAKIEIFNMDPQLRASLTVGTLCVLTAGYPDNTGVIFRGQLAEMEVEQNEGSTVTTLQCADSEPVILYCTLHKTYASTVTLAQILQDICGVLSVTIGGTAYQAAGHKLQGIPDISWPRRTLHGPVRDILDKLLHPLGVNWSMQNGSLLVQGGPKNRLNFHAVVLNPKTGLLGVPKVGAEGVGFRALIQPGIVPGNAVSVALPDGQASKNLRVVKATFKGDTLGGDWTVEALGQTLVGPLAAYVPKIAQTDDAAEAVDDDAGDAEDAY